MQKITGILLTVAAVIAFNCSALEVEMKGTAKDSSGNGLADVTVNLYSAADNLTAVNDKGYVDISKLKSPTTATTGSDGSFTAKVTAGAYIVTFTKSCYTDDLKGIGSDRKPSTSSAITAPGTVTGVLAGGCTTVAAPAATTAGAATAGAGTSTGSSASWTVTAKDSAGTSITGTSASPTGVATGKATVSFTFTGTVGSKTPVMVTDVKVAGGTLTRTMVAVKLSSTSGTANYIINKAATACFSMGLATDVNDVSTLSDTSATIVCGADSAGTTTTTDNIIAIMSWDTDGTDVDLHALDLTAQTELYWGRLSISAMGTLDLDNVSGYGPETITITSANNTKFGAHAWSVSTATNVTLRVILPNASPAYDKTFKKTDFATTVPASGNWIIFGTWSKTGEST